MEHNLDSQYLQKNSNFILYNKKIMTETMKEGLNIDSFKLVIIILFIITISCTATNMNKAKCVPDRQKAIEIAEQKWLSIYGVKIFNNKPFNAKLIDNVWIVEGTLNSQKGGVPYIEINANNCEIIKVSHSK